MSTLALAQKHVRPAEFEYVLDEWILEQDGRQFGHLQDLILNIEEDGADGYYVASILIGSSDDPRQVVPVAVLDEKKHAAIAKEIRDYFHSPAGQVRLHEKAEELA